MTEHLRYEEMIDALDDALGSSRRAHLAGCAVCQAELESLTAALREAQRTEAPAPSPLFWEHFSDRVRQATAAEPVPTPAWWRAWWRPVGAVAGAVGAVALVAVLRTLPPPGVIPDVERGPTMRTGSAADDGSWGLVIGLASELDWADVREAAKPADGTADAMIEELTAAQRTALVRLLQQEIGEQ